MIDWLVSSLLKYCLPYTIRVTRVGSTFLDLCRLFLTKVLGQLDLRIAHVRANLAGALVRLNPGRHDSADGHGRGIDPGQQQLRHLFGLGERRSSWRFERDLTMTSFVSDATELNGHQIKFIGELKKAVQKGNSRERTAATLTLLKLCESGFGIINEPDINSCFISYNHPPSSP
jgi:hypothetical protein